MPSFPPLAWWFSFFCLALARLVRFLWVVFHVLFFCVAVLSLPYTRGCSCDAYVFLPSASSFREYVPWRPCRHSSGVFRCVLSVLGVFLLLVLLLFLPVLVHFVSPRSLSQVFFWGGSWFLCVLSSPVSSSSSASAGSSSSSSSAPASSVFLVLTCGASRFVGFWRVLFSLLSLQPLLLLLLLLSSLRFHRSCSGPPLPVFSFWACCVS